MTITPVLANHDDGTGNHPDPSPEPFYKNKQYTLETDYVRYNIPYTIEQDIVNTMNVIVESASILIDVTPHQNEISFEIDIPFSLFENKHDDGDCCFILMDGEEIDAEKYLQQNYTHLEFSIPPDTKQIEIINAFIPTDDPPKTFQIIHDPPYSYILPPYKQMKNNVDIICKEHLQVIERYDGREACVTSVTKQHLMDRGWAIPQSLDEIKQNPESIRQNIIRIDDDKGRISLYPENTCASIFLELLAEQDMQIYKNDNNEPVDDGNANILEIKSDDLKEIPHIEELIYAVHLIEFPYNDSHRIYFDGIDFVEYEFFLMDKMIEKYGGTQEDYFMKLDADYEERLTNPKLQGFSNEFLAPQIVYNQNVYSIGGTVFWTSDEHNNNLSMSVHLRDAIDETQKSVILTEDDMESIPKIKEAIENIGTIQESISAHIGLPEEEKWNQYREWFKQKSQERLNADTFGLIQYDEHVYSVVFGIC